MRMGTEGVQRSTWEYNGEQQSSVQYSSVGSQNSSVQCPVKEDECMSDCDL